MQQRGRDTQRWAFACHSPYGGGQLSSHSHCGGRPVTRHGGGPRPSLTLQTRPVACHSHYRHAPSPVTRTIHALSPVNPHACPALLACHSNTTDMPPSPVTPPPQTRPLTSHPHYRPAQPRPAPSPLTQTMEAGTLSPVTHTMEAGTLSVPCSIGSSTFSL